MLIKFWLRATSFPSMTCLHSLLFHTVELLPTFGFSMGGLFRKKVAGVHMNYALRLCL